MRVGVKVGGKQDDGNDRETVVVRNDVCVPEKDCRVSFESGRGRSVKLSVVLVSFPSAIECAARRTVGV